MGLCDLSTEVPGPARASASLGQAEPSESKHGFNHLVTVTPSTSPGGPDVDERCFGYDRETRPEFTVT